MGKNYVENSLKHFLKKKVKITLGFVVAFLITGVISFGTEITDIPIGYENRVTIGKETNISENINDNFKVKIDGQEKEASLFVIDGAKVFNDKEINVYDSKGQKAIGKVYVKNAEFTNKGLVNLLEINSGKAINNGKIMSDEKNGHWMADGTVNISGENTTFINEKNGVVRSRNICIRIEEESKNAEIYNYGLMESIIDEKGTRGADNITLGGDNTKIYNYGIIRGYQLLISAVNDEENNAVFYNYGYLGSKKNLFSDQINGLTLKNYGTINYKNCLGVFDFNHSKVLYTLENKGVIFRDIDDEFHQKNKEQKFNNYGIFFTDTQNDAYVGFDEGYEVRGAVLDKENLNLLNGGEGKNGDKTVKDMSNEIVISNATINDADNLFINNKSLKLDLGEKLSNGQGQKITGKAITAISQTAGNIVLDNSKDDGITGNKHLTLEDTTIIGYFEKDGTLLKVDGDLTLGENAFINAVAVRDEEGNILDGAKNVYAVDVSGELTYKEGQILGKINGGEKSVINVEGGSDINILNNEIFGKGEINLNDGDWTKGENCSIILDGDKAVVNVDGNLVGYLTKDGDTTTKAGDNILNTTLDGMITGKGTLNVDKIRFDMGDLKINDLEDAFTINGNKDIHVENALDKIDTSVIFNKEIKDGNVVLTLKSADEMGIHDPEKQKLYNELIKNYGKDAETDEIIDKGTVEKIANLVGGIDKLIELMATSGVKITRDIAGAFTDSVNEFDKKANKGEWLTNAKYIGSDMEYDGTSTVNGYDSDINSMVGMAEYGISDSTSLGFAVGGGDTDIDLKELNGKSTSLDGHNYYAGIYTKHSINGFDMTGSFGYIISDLDVENGGSADSEAFTLAGYIKRDINLTDTIKLQPNVAFAYDYIKQDTAEMGKGMSINSGDYHIFEADMGMNIIKEIAFEKGNLELKAGIKYSMTNVDRNKEITGKYYEADVNLGSPEIDDKKGTAHIGFDYEHETGFGVNGKYETMWSDSGDDSRITAGVSYRF